MKITETSLSRVWQYANGKRPFSILTGFRGEYSREENIRRNKSIAAKIRQMGYGFFYLDGYWVENAGTSDEVRVSEDSLFVIGNSDEDIFLSQMIALGAEYGQDGVLVKTSDGTKIYDQQGEVIADIGTLRPNRVGDAYSRLRKDGRTFIFEEERDDLGWIRRLAGIK